MRKPLPPSLSLPHKGGGNDRAAGSVQLARLTAPQKHNARAEGPGTAYAYATSPESWERMGSADADEELNVTWKAGCGALRAALGRPGAGAGAAAPVAFAGRGAEAAGAGGVLVAVADLDRHRAVAADLAGDVERGVARVLQALALDRDRITIGAIAIALLGDDHHAPLAIEIAGRLHGRRGDEKAEAESGCERAAEGGRGSHYR